MAVKTSHDCFYINDVLQNSLSYNFNKDGSLNALESAYYWGNDTAFECVLRYLLRKNDTLFIQNSHALGMAIFSGDTLNVIKLFSIYGERLNEFEKIDIIRDFVDFIENYNLINVYRSGFSDKDDFLSTTVDYDLRMADILIRYGIDFNLPNEDGENIMFYCMDISTVARYFIEGRQKIDLNKVDNKGYSFLQLYIDKIVQPKSLNYAQLEANEKGNNFYTKKIDLLNYYINAGATVGPEHQNGWKYLMGKLKSVENPFLLDLIRSDYSEYIK